MDAAVGKAIDLFVGPINRQIDYIKDYEVLLQTTITEVQKLEGSKDCVQHTVEEAEKNGKIIENIVLNWLDRAVETIAKAKELIDREAHTKAKHRRHVHKRHKLGRHMHYMIQEILKVLEDGEFQRISYDGPSNVTVTPSGRVYVALDSRTSILDKIMMALKDPNFFIIGVYGMGGVGKTKLVEQLAWKAKNDPSFDVVVEATITDSPNVENIQTQIADSLPMKFTKETRDGRAGELRDRMKTKNSILVILDDIWRGFNLLEVGIPLGDDHKGCKLVVISRDLNVLTSELRTHIEFPIDFLQKKESWKLFEQIAGWYCSRIKTNCTRSGHILCWVAPFDR